MIFIILPCHNEEQVVGESARILLDYLGALPEGMSASSLQTTAMDRFGKFTWHSHATDWPKK